ncbi:nuclear transport factor 2 family protein [Calothrix sp. NIES-3974]|uniref:nuclear transport factor 2 family protein n=1 Tax=Calothrix sp. NIES-3974 TaxID=2005462 RepID=UPI000B5E4944|nr:nuclear transport factor 2 family protein [Calothrix sp. NIES-3974]BAZ03625.1 hypothetical protein NIES3974_02540 [Calothrix sp. NIES-3974]
MFNLTNVFFRSSSSFRPQPQLTKQLIFFTLTLISISGWQYTRANAQQQPPAQLQNLIAQIDNAANKGDVKGVIQHYSPNFTHTDGLNRQQMEQALTSLWKRYPRLRYNTTIQSWKSEGNTITAETITKISGLPSSNRNNFALNSTIRSRQRIVGTKIESQEVLSERTLITAGAKPPQVEVKAPEKVKVGQQFSFDAIVQEPMGDDYLLGTALNEPIQPERFLNPTSVELQLLNAGGLFKIGRAPNNPGSHWLSAVIMRGEGTTMVTQRIQVVK